MKSEPEQLLLFSRIRTALCGLSKRERAIADYILEHPDSVAGSSAARMAALTGTSGATVVRFCRSCGFSGWSEMKLYLQREVLTADSQRESVAYGDSVAVVKQKVRSYHESILNNMVNQWDEENYQAAARALANAGRVLFAGVGGSQATVQTLMDTFLDFGIHCEFYSDPAMSTYKTAQLGPGDVLFVVMYTGSFVTLVEDMRLAREKGATVILLTGVPESPASRYADISLLVTFITRENVAISISVRVAELVVIEVLYALVEQTMRKRGRPKLGIDRYLNANRIPGKWPLSKP